MSAAQWEDKPLEFAPSYAAVRCMNCRSISGLHWNGQDFICLNGCKTDEQRRKDNLAFVEDLLWKWEQDLKWPT